MTTTTTTPTTARDQEAAPPPARPRQKIYLEKRSEFMVVMPHTARAWIDRTQARNRKTDPRWVDYLADQIQESWDENGEPIILDWFGDIVDGRHRLTACAKSGRPMRTNVVTGVDPKSFRTIDNNKARNKGDYLHVAGEASGRKLAAVLRSVRLWEIGRLGSDKVGTRDSGIGPEALIDTLARHPGTRASVCAGSAYYHRFRGVGQAQWAFLHYALGRVDPELRDQFLEALASGESLKPGHPAAALRNRLVNNMQSRSKLRPADVLAVTIKAWRAFARGEPVRNLAWRRGGDTPEAFPRLDPFRDEDFPLAAQDQEAA
jgi:hypothetical protein